MRCLMTIVIIAVCVWWLQAVKKSKLTHIYQEANKYNYVSMIQPSSSFITAAQLDVTEAVGCVISHSFGTLNPLSDITLAIWWEIQSNVPDGTISVSARQCHTGNGLHWCSNCSDHSLMMKDRVKSVSLYTVTF